MKVLLIGGTIFIGPPVVRRLADLGHEGAVFHRGQTKTDLPLGVEHLIGDRHSHVSHVAEPVAYAEAEWVRTIGEMVGGRGEVVTVPDGRIPLPYNMGQSLDTDSTRIRTELGFAEIVNPKVGIERTIAWERANLSGSSTAIGLSGYEAEDAVLDEIGLARHRED